ncbi:hypothetical protein PIB30_065448, partial [Stylosanthes scabra]|nr:hypothetical protein [Stylosanthes scabra]
VANQKTCRNNDPLDDFDGFIAQDFQDPQGDAVVPIEEHPKEDPMEEDEGDEEMADTDLEDEDLSEEEELSAGLEPKGSGVIYYEIEKCEKYEDTNERADWDLAVVKMRRYHFDNEPFIHPLHSIRFDPDRPYEIPD